MLRTVYIAGIIIVLVSLVVQIRAWRAGTRVLSKRHKGLRVSSACIMIVVMSMVLVGDRWLANIPLAVMAYWVLCFGLAVALVIVALLDLKEVGLSFGEERKRIVREIAERRKEDSDGG